MNSREMWIDGREPFTPESKRHRDRWARTMAEAFGHGAVLHVEQPHHRLTFMHIAVCVPAVAFLLLVLCGMA